MSQEKSAEAITSPSAATAPLSAIIQALSSPRAQRSRLWRGIWWAVLGLGLLLLSAQAWLASQQPNDFCQDYQAAQHLLQGHSAYLPVQCWAGISNVPVTIEYNPHPPTSVLLAYPFGLLPFPTATLLWGCFCLAAYLVAGWLLLSEVGWRSLPGIALFTFGSGLWPALRLSLSLQNLGEFTLLLLVGAWLLERHGKHRWAGVLLGLAALLKLWPTLLLLGAILYGRRAVVRSALLTIGSVTILTVLVLGPQAIADYLGPVQINERAWVPAQENLSIVGAVTRPLTGYDDHLVAIPRLLQGVSLSSAVLLGELVAGLVLLATLLFLWRCRQRGKSAVGEWLAQGVLITMLLLIFPVTWYWSLTLLLLPGAMLLLALRQLPRPPTWWLLTLLITLLIPFGAAWPCIWLADKLLAQPHNTLTGWATLLYDVPTIALLALAGLQGWLLWNMGQASLHKNT
ncbi:MAG TPA: glycosyltransferase family 87 protein [Ktedonobacterales bacterium]|jgi:hypothetical protein